MDGKPKSLKDRVLSPLGATLLALLTFGLGILQTKLTTRQADLSAVIRFGREPPADPKLGQDTGYYDIRISNEGSRPAKAVRLIVADAVQVVISKTPGHAAEIRPVANDTIELGDLATGDLMILFVRVQGTTTEDTANAIKFSQDDGATSKVVYVCAEPDRPLIPRALSSWLMFAAMLMIAMTVRSLRRRGDALTKFLTALAEKQGVTLPAKPDGS